MLRQRHNSSDRRGVILMVVLALLTLFTIIGITFVYVSDSYVLSSTNAKNAQNIYRPGMEPELALSIVLGQLIYDVNDDAFGIQSSLRGHSLARNMYGWNYDPTSSNYLPNEVPYSGVGRLRLTTPLGGTWTEQDLIHFKYFAADGFLRDPERLGTRANLAAARGGYVCGAVPYNYADANNAFLAVLDPNKNEIVTPSFHRSYLFGALNNAGNPNWTNQAGRYLTLRPRPAENNSANNSGPFPFPTDPGGDVRNYDGGVGGNDSIWLDVNAPIFIAPNGQAYKMLVAPLILELDSRVNLNAHGNILGTGNTHAGNQGWGPWEVNLHTVFNNTEWPNLFLGNPSTGGTPRVQGRYGPTRQPILNGVLPLYGARGWAPIDLNGVNDPAPGTPTLVYTLPTGTSHSPWANFPAAGYGNGAAKETTNHPLGFNPIAPAVGNRLLPYTDTVALLRAGGTNAEFLSCDVARLCPTSFSGTPYLHRLTTTIGADLDRPGVVPYIWDPTTTPYILSPVAANSTTPYMLTGPALPTNPLSTTGQSPTALATATATLPANSEFEPAPGGTGTTFRSLLSQVAKLNLNTPLTPYPAPDANGLIDTVTPASLTQLQKAIQDRQNLASQIFTLLQKATGALPPSAVNVLPAAQPTKVPQWNSLRYLAQMAVNIVDFIDSDGYSTPFMWWNPAAGGPEWVYGVEMSRLVLNEVYAQLNNDPNDGGIYSNPATGTLVTPAASVKATSFYYSNVWVELLNPFNIAIDSGVDVPARLAIKNGMGSYSVYQIILAATAPGSGASVALQDPRNQTGDPNFSTVAITGNTTTGSNTITNLPATNNLVVGSLVTGPGIPPNSVITAVNGGAPPSVTISNKATATATGVSLTAIPTRSVFNNFTVGPPVAPVGTAYPPGTDKTGLAGFYVVGPVQDAATATATGTPIPYSTVGTKIENPNLATHTSLESPAMSIQVPIGSAFPQYTVVLQRLLCPGMPPNPDPTNPLYNPYITVDYIDTTTSTNSNTPPAVGTAPVTVANDFRHYNDTGAITPVPVRTNMQAQERVQPWVASNIEPCTTAVAAQPKHTFLRHNGTTAAAPTGRSHQFEIPFRWLSHLDRQLTSKAELLNVAYCRPHDLTQLFHQGTIPTSFTTYPSANYNKQLIPWTDPTTRLYRFLELADVPPPVVGLASGGRVPGRINVNGDAIFRVNNQPLVLQALLDRQTSDQFSAANVNTFATSLLAARTPGYTNSPPTLNTTDNPYWGLGLGAATGPTALSTQTPSIGPALSSALVTSATTWNPYEKSEFLNKFFTTTTTRSNVYAIWLTVGFFEVDPSSGQLGPEIGIAEGRQVRHRMFALVDRTNLMAMNGSEVQNITVTPPTPTKVYISATSAVDSRTGRTWSLRPNMILVYDPNMPNEESVVTQLDTTNNKIYAMFLKSHAAGARVISRGNPGPWIRYDPRQDPEVVPYFAVIE